MFFTSDPHKTEPTHIENPRSLNGSIESSKDCKTMALKELLHQGRPCTSHLGSDSLIPTFITLLTSDCCTANIPLYIATYVLIDRTLVDTGGFLNFLAISFFRHCFSRCRGLGPNIFLGILEHASELHRFFIDIGVDPFYTNTAYGTCMFQRPVEQTTIIIFICWNHFGFPILRIILTYLRMIRTLFDSYLLWWHINEIDAPNLKSNLKLSPTIHRKAPP
ncbi:hypothetical protein ABKN59_011942 [Abortiporus biennis]